MRTLLIGMLLIAAVGVAHAADSPLLKCLIDGEKEGVDNKNCPAFDRAIDCGVRLQRDAEGALARTNEALAQRRERLSSFKSGKRRQMMELAVSENEQAVAEGETAVAKMKEAIVYLKREKQEAGCSPPPTAAASTSDCSQAETHWKSVEEIKTLAAYQDHLRRFPNCNFAALATARIEQLGRQDGDKPAPALRHQ